MMTDRRRLMMAIGGGGSQPPAESFVEYIESTGSQFVTLNCNATTDTKAVLDYQRTVLNDASILSNTNHSSAWNLPNVFLIGAWSAGPSYACRFNNTTGPSANVAPITLNRTTLELDKTGLVVDGNRVWTINQTISQNYPILLFDVFRDHKAYFKFYSLEIYEAGVLTHLYRPKRVGAVGYVYDTVTDTLLSNTGSGDFILGPDI